MSDAALMRIAAALERMSPAPFEPVDFSAADAFVWQVGPDRLLPVHNVNRVDLNLFKNFMDSSDQN
ncbi:MAG: AAA family ATPase, partial [Paracoccaceae bacterium]